MNSSPPPGGIPYTVGTSPGPPLPPYRGIGEFLIPVSGLQSRGRGVYRGWPAGHRRDPEYQGWYEGGEGILDNMHSS
jgi:hypothetical protein